MILHNLDAAHGVCNGSRGILTQCRNRVLEVQLITGEHTGSNCSYPGLPISPLKTKWHLSLPESSSQCWLCFGMMINKSQGQSVGNVGLDLRSPVTCVDNDTWAILCWSVKGDFKGEDQGDLG
jgi:ATP-dependent DNA helicase PIF1